MSKLSTCPITGKSSYWYPIARRAHILASIRGSVHLIPGHVTINTEANALFQTYQRQAARGEIQFRRWPLRAVSFYLHYIFITLVS